MGGHVGAFALAWIATLMGLSVPSREHARARQRHHCISRMPASSADSANLALGNGVRRPGRVSRGRDQCRLLSERVPAVAHRASHCQRRPPCAPHPAEGHAGRARLELGELGQTRLREPKAVASKPRLSKHLEAMYGSTTPSCRPSLAELGQRPGLAYERQLFASTSASKQWLTRRFQHQAGLANQPHGSPKLMLVVAIHRGRQALAGIGPPGAAPASGKVGEKK